MRKNIIREAHFPRLLKEELSYFGKQQRITIDAI